MAYTDIDVILTVQQTRWQKLVAVLIEHPFTLLLAGIIILIMLVVWKKIAFSE